MFIFDPNKLEKSYRLSGNQLSQEPPKGKYVVVTEESLKGDASYLFLYSRKGSRKLCFTRELNPDVARNLQTANKNRKRYGENLCRVISLSEFYGQRYVINKETSGGYLRKISIEYGWLILSSPKAYLTHEEARQAAMKEVLSYKRTWTESLETSKRELQAAEDALNSLDPVSTKWIVSLSNELEPQEAKATELS